jgi:DNA-binding PucR family transcriptional regulator
VHPNTVKYRLKRASELLNLDLGDLDSLLTVKIALMVASLRPDDFDGGLGPGAALHPGR